MFQRILKYLKSDEPQLGELPPEGYPVGIYIGLFFGGLILGIGAVILLRELLITFTKKSLDLSPIVLFQLLLLSLSAFASLACFFALVRAIRLEREQMKKVDREFKDFTRYARPLIEEVIKQRIVGEKLLEKLEKYQRLATMEENRICRLGGGASDVEMPDWGEFLLFVVLLTGISMTLFLYLGQRPWELVPYSVIILAVAWWVVMAKYFGLLGEPKAYYLPALFILVMPTVSIVLRAYMEPYKVVYFIFLTLFFYVLAIYLQLSYLSTGALPSFLKIRRPGPGRGIPPMLRDYFPPRKIIEEKETPSVASSFNFKKLGEMLRAKIIRKET